MSGAVVVLVDAAGGVASDGKVARNLVLAQRRASNDGGARRRSWGRYGLLLLEL